jgi:hypothetical protein
MKYLVTVETNGSGAQLEITATSENAAKTKALEQAGEGYSVTAIEVL